MARGLRAGDGGAHLMTLHPPGGNSSSTWFHDDDWLDFNMRQNGHATEFTGRYDQTRVDYDRTPIKPVLDGEPIYEDHPVSFNAKNLGHSIASDVRRPLYWDLFSGAFGHTYGHHSVWQMWAPGAATHQQSADAVVRGHRSAGRGPDAARPRADRVAPVPHAYSGSLDHRDRTGADQRPWRGPLSVHLHARRSGSYAMVYAPVGRPVHRQDEQDHGRESEGVVVQSARRQGHGHRHVREHRRARVHAARQGEMLDWVLVLDDESKHYPPPGRHK